jgi:sarcosine oxidase
LKVLTEEYIETTTADHVDRDIKPEEVAQMVKMTQDHLHGVTDKLMHADVCMYTHTTDDDFIIDFHPDSKRVVIASPCSGHGFKHSAAIGEALAEMALQGKSTLDINHFSLSRFTTKEQ